MNTLYVCRFGVCDVGSSVCLIVETERAGGRERGVNWINIEF